jgi:hypothetical protein
MAEITIKEVIVRGEKLVEVMGWKGFEQEMDLPVKYVDLEHENPPKSIVTEYNWGSASKAIRLVHVVQGVKNHTYLKIDKTCTMTEWDVIVAGIQDAIGNLRKVEATLEQENKEWGATKVFIF